MSDGLRRRRRRPAGLLPGIASLTTRRPRLVASVWIAIVAVLAIVGRNLDQELGIHPLYIDGTASKRGARGRWCAGAVGIGRVVDGAL